jgi:hypothetical protein
MIFVPDPEDLIEITIRGRRRKLLVDYTEELDSEDLFKKVVRKPRTRTFTTSITSPDEDDGDPFIVIKVLEQAKDRELAKIDRQIQELRTRRNKLVGVSYYKLDAGVYPDVYYRAKDGVRLQMFIDDVWKDSQYKTAEDFERTYYTSYSTVTFADLPETIKKHERDCE